MGRFNKGSGKFFGHGGFGRKDFDRGENRGDRRMYKATCSNCGKECELPFQPTNSKPVYCNDCFPKFGGHQRSNDRPERGRFHERREGSDGGDLKRQIDILNSKLDKVLSLLQPNNDGSKQQESVKKEAVSVAADVKTVQTEAEKNTETGSEEKPEKVKKTTKKASKKSSE